MRSHKLHIVNLRMIQNAEMELGQGSPGQRIAGSGRVKVSVSDPIFDPVLSFKMPVDRCFVSTDQSNTISANYKCLNDVKSRNVVM